MRVLVVGAGGHGLVVADILKCAAEKGQDLQVAGFLDDDEHLWGRDLGGVPVLGGVNRVSELPHDGVIVAIGDNARRKVIFKSIFASGGQFVIARHPDSTVASDVRLAPGTMICAGVRVNPGAIVDEDVILNTGCTIDHHNHIGSHVHIAPGVHLGGNVEIGDGSLIGIGAVVLPGRRTGKGVIVGAGSVVTRDIEDYQTVVGAPARPIVRRK